MILKRKADKIVVSQHRIRSFHMLLLSKVDSHRAKAQMAEID